MVGMDNSDMVGSDQDNLDLSILDFVEVWEETLVLVLQLGHFVSY